MAAPSSDHKDQVVTLRKRWRLSQRQFADLFMTTVRTVKRWESGQSSMTAHQQWFLWLFVQYIERNGMRKFRRQFVLQTLRHGRAGRPSRGPGTFC